MEMLQDRPNEHYVEPIISLSAPTDHSRLSIPTSIRIPGATAIGFGVGALLGATYGAKTAALRFRAENAHRLPTSTKGWYLYHKSKNYNSLYETVKGAGKMGSKIAFWTGGFFFLETMVDGTRGGRKDFLSTTLSGLTIAGLFNLWSTFCLFRSIIVNVETDRFPMYSTTSVRIARTGFLGGLVFGLAQDALTLVRGRQLAYVDFIISPLRQHEDVAQD